MSAPVLVLVVVAAIALVSLPWRLLSRRQSLPCPVWLRWLVELDNPFTKTNRAAFIVETLSLSPGMTVLDAGCGPGRLTVPLARGVGSAGHVVALDVQAGMLSRAKAKTEAAGLKNVEFVAASLGDRKLPANRFDRAVLVTVLGEIPDRTAAFAELFGALEPGGLLAVVEVIFDPHFQSRATVTALAVSAGFREHAFIGHRLAYVIHFVKAHAGQPCAAADAARWPAALTSGDQTVNEEQFRQRAQEPGHGDLQFKDYVPNMDTPLHAHAAAAIHSPKV
ncbi:MAG: methyltransferase domain-containing protein [Candidatus Accumulibacter sp.]|nr:methyltransferase domain-containing protein [Accumulibacter sp.]MCP5229920.1 methyltransferase domain-containing protein [Accumulibacter sp.]